MTNAKAEFFEDGIHTSRPFPAEFVRANTVFLFCSPLPV